MKRLFLSTLMLCASFGLLQAAYVPAAGPLQLSGHGGVAALAAQRGAIMQAIVSNGPANLQAHPKLLAANIALENFDQRGQNFSPYQTIMHNISQSINTQQALDAARAIETVIMHLYDYEAYMLGSYRPGQSIFVTGLRWSWINPCKYLPKNWFSDNNPKLKQLIDELEQLADIVSVHDSIMSARLKATVHSYRHWRRNLALTCAAYLTADMAYHGYNESIVNEFYQGGLSNSGAIAMNHVINIRNGAVYAGKGLVTGVKGGWSYVFKPLGKAIFGGVNAFKEKKENEKPKEPNKPNKVPVKVPVVVKKEQIPDATKLPQVKQVQQVTTPSLWSSFLQQFPVQRYQDLTEQKKIAEQKVLQLQAIEKAAEEQKERKAAILKAVQEKAKAINASKNVAEKNDQKELTEKEQIKKSLKSIWTKAKESWKKPNEF